MEIKKTLITAALLATSVSASATDVYQQGYVRSDGTYVQPHHQTAPNDTRYDNYSTRGNVNPYTGQAGTVNPDRDTYHQPIYHQPQPYYQQPNYPAQPAYKTPRY